MALDSRSRRAGTLLCPKGEENTPRNMGRKRDENGGIVMSESTQAQLAAKKAARLKKREERAAKRAQRLEKAAGRPLNRFFHHIDRGSTMGREVAAGILMCILGVCGIFMNMQLLSRYFIDITTMDSVAMGEAYAQFYFLAMIAAFVGSLLMGVVARLPLVQVSGLGLSTVLISSLGVGSGLSYANLLAVCFISSVVYTGIAVVPPVRRAVLRAIPKSVRQAMPAAVGLLAAFIALQLTGLVSFGSSALTVQGTGTVLSTAKILKVNPDAQIASNVQLGRLFDFAAYNEAGYKGDSYYPLMQIGLIAVAAAFAAYMLLHKTKHAMLYSLLAGTVVYFAGYLTNVVFYVTKSGAIQYELDSLWARLWMVGSEDAMHLHLPTILSNLSLGSLLKEGFDFTAYTEAGGSVGGLMAVGILTNLALMIGCADATVQAVAVGEEKDEGRALVCNGVMNLLAPVAGLTPASISCASAAGKKDGARSGLASIVASIGFLVSAFVWIVPFIFATTTSYEIQFNMYGHYGKVLYMLVDNSFLVADAVMVLIGLHMAVSSMRIDWNLGREAVPFVATVAATLAVSSPALGLAVGIVAHLLVSVLDRERQLTLGNVIAAAVSIALVVVTCL